MGAFNLLPNSCHVYDPCMHMQILTFFSGSVLSVEAPKEQAMPIFTGVFVIVWAGAAVVTVNSQLLGGAVSFFQSVCVIGYCLFPIVASAIVAVFVKFIWIRLPIAIVSFAWSTYGLFKL